MLDASEIDAWIHSDFRGQGASGMERTLESLGVKHAGSQPSGLLGVFCPLVGFVVVVVLKPPKSFRLASPVKLVFFGGRGHLDRTAFWVISMSMLGRKTSLYGYLAGSLDFNFLVDQASWFAMCLFCLSRSICTCEQGGPSRNRNEQHSM